MGRRDPDPRPPIEVLGGEPEAASLQRVSTGPRGPGRRPGRGLAVAAGVVVLLIGGLALSGGDDPSTTAPTDEPEERDNHDRAVLKPRPPTTTTRPRPTTTTTTLPVGPVFGAPVPARLVAWGNGRWHVVDLATGTRTELDLPSPNAYGARAVAGGIVLPSLGSNRVARYYPVGPDGVVAEPIDLGVADQLLGAGTPDRLWLVDGGGTEYEEGGALIDQEADVRLVDLRGQVLRHFQIESRYVSRGVAAGVVVERAGRVYIADEQGLRPIAVGYVVGALGDDLLVLGCDDRGECAVSQQPLDGGSARHVLDAPDIEDYGYDSVTAADGRIAVVTYGGRGAQELLLFTAEGQPIGQLDWSGAVTVGGPPSWLPGEAGLVTPAGDRVRWVRPRDGGTWEVVSVPVLEDLPAELVLVIED